LILNLSELYRSDIVWKTELDKNLIKKIEEAFYKEMKELKYL
jgi:hypothetical protein